MKFITVVRGRLKDADGGAAQAAHDAIVAKLMPVSQPLGATGHRVYLNAQDRRQFLAIDGWESLEGLQKFMSDPNTAATMGQMFDGPPEVAVYAAAGWLGF